MVDNNNTIDYAAIIRAAQEHLPDTPDWLAVGKQIYSTERGSGEVKALLGKRLVVCFGNEDTLTQISDWPLAITQGQLAACSTALAASTSTTSALDVSLSEQLSAIPDPAFRAVAQELALNLTSIRSTEANTGTLYPLPEDLPSDLRSVLNRIGMSHLYSHQIEALESLRAGLDLSMCTQTASGKTLCYNVAILESCLKQPSTTSLYIFPLKALALDQMQKLSELVSSLPIKIALMTGDTPKDERQRLFIPNPPNILAVSPDLLHHYLYNARRQDGGEPWRQFLRQLRYIVIDESHTYTGAFGAHFTNLMRRLRLAVDSVGGNSDKLQFICTSATIGNPEEMALRFSGRTERPERLRLIQHSGARSAGRTILCLNPSSTANPDACRIVLSWLQHDLSGIVFCNSRAAVKNLLGLIQRQTARQGISHLAQKVAIFYGSLKGDRRREIIQQLKQGRLKVILATSALEAGIDLPELQCCLIRGFPGSLMSFWQRVGRAGRNQHGLVIFLPVAQNILDDFYGSNPEQLLSGEVESAAFNPQYPTILSKHLECGCVESGIPLASLTSRFGQAAGAIADSLLQQDKLYLSRNNQIWGKGYPHKNVSLRGSTQDAISLIDKDNGETIEEMSLALAQRELFPGAIYMAQDAEGKLIAYRSESLDEERKSAVLVALENNDLFTQAESELDIQLLSKLAEPKIVPTAIPEARLRLTLAWGKITTLVTGYRQLVRAYVMTCTNSVCPNYRQSLEGQICASCKRNLHSAEITKVVEEVQFEEPLQTQYQAPCVKVELNPPLVSAIQAQVDKIKESVRATHGNDIPEQFKDLWDCAPEFIALHSMLHQIIKAVPLVILSSSLDVDTVVETTEGRTVGYFYDTCDDGTGSAEAIFHQLSQFASKAKALAQDCDCESGCPRCLTQHGCPQQNTGLHKDAGLFLLDAISQEALVNQSGENHDSDR